MLEFPDWLRGIALVGKSGLTYVPVAVDANGNMYILMQGTDGATLRPVLLDSAGRIIGTLIDPVSGNYVAVDASGRLTTVVKGEGPGGVLSTLAVDASGQLVMVPRGASGNYMAVDGNGFLTTVMKGAYGILPKTIQTDATGNMVAVIFDPATGRTVAVDVNGFLTTVMKGADGGTLRTIAVDATGNLISLMKGMHGATLEPVAVDGSGRMVSIVMDDTDQWGNVLQGGFAELAARLGSIVTYDRRGQSIFTENFSSGFGNWIKTGSAGYYVRLNPVSWLHGGYSIELYPGSVDGNTVYFNKYIGAFPVGTGIGLSAWWYFSIYPGWWLMRVKFYDGALLHDVNIRGTYTDGKLWYYNAAGAWVNFSTWYVGIYGSQTFRYAKMVFNPTTHKFVRFILDKVSIDMSALSYYTAASSDQTLILQFGLEADGTNNGPCMLDDVVLTTSEPA